MRHSTLKDDIITHVLRTMRSHTVLEQAFLGEIAVDSVNQPHVLVCNKVKIPFSFEESGHT